MAGTLKNFAVSQSASGIPKVAKRYRSIFFFVILLFLLGSAAATALEAQTADYKGVAGVPSFSTSLPVENGFVNAANGNLHLEIPLGSFPERNGRQYKLALTYDSNIWYIVPATYSYFYGLSPAYWTSYDPYSTSGWRFVAPVGHLDRVLYQDTCYNDDDEETEVYSNDYSQFVYVEGNGTTHPFGGDADYSWADEGCGIYSGTSYGDTAYAADASGYKLVTDALGNGQVYAPDGTKVYDDNGPPDMLDSNGNFFWGVWDHLGRTTYAVSTSGSDIYYDVLNSQGTTSRYTVTTSTISVDTNFGVSGTNEYSGSITVVDSIELPDGTTYQLGYDYGSSAGHFGELTSMELPTGGTIDYSYGLFTDVYGDTSHWINSRTTPDGTWSYTPSSPTCSGSCTQEVTVTKPSGDNIVYVSTLNGGAWNTEIDYYNGSVSSPNLLASTAQSYNFSDSCPTGAYCPDSGAANVVKTQETTTLNSAGGTTLKKTTEQTVDQTYGNLTELKEWNFYTGSLPGTADRTTDIDYVNGSSYLNNNIINRPSRVYVTDSSSNLVKDTWPGYDEWGPSSATGVAGHDDTDYGTGNTVRGNLTTVTQLVSGSTYLTKAMAYDMTGQMTEVQDIKGNDTSFSYSDCYKNDAGTSQTTVSGGATKHGNVTTITPPSPFNSMTTSLCYYWGTGQPANATDANGNTSTFHFYDSFNRPTIAEFANGGWTLNQYNVASSLETGADTYTGITDTTASSSCSSCRHDKLILDSLGRSATVKLVSDPDDTTDGTTVATTYDSNGRVKTVSNPYRTTSDATYGVETQAYDGLDRVTSSTHPDSDVAHVSYGAAVTALTSQYCSTGTYGYGYPTLVVDEVGNKRETWTDGFGRMIEADEPDSSGSLSGSNSLHTCYSYDLNGNLTAVAASDGTQTRSYSYDKLSRLTSKTEPETGTTTISYTSSGSPCSGDPSAPCSRTDARSITTTYTYDALNRLTEKDYSDGTNSTYLLYDQTSDWGVSLSNSAGRLTEIHNYSSTKPWSAEIFSYDAMGGVTTNYQCTPVNCGTSALLFNYSYNLDGSIHTVTYPNGRVVTYTTGNAQRPTAATDTTNSINYASGSSYPMYTPAGAPSSIVYGYVSGGGMTESRTYSNRMQLTGIQAVAAGTATTILDLAYSYAQSSHDNGNIVTQTNNVDTGRTQNYTYDPLNRLLTAESSASSGGDCWGQSLGNNTGPTLAADGLANMFYATSTQCSSPQPRYTMSGSDNNRFSDTGFSYDSSGNDTADASHSYTFDAENRIASVDGTYCYTYDGNGLRTTKGHVQSGYTCSDTGAHAPIIDISYWRNLDGDTIAETDGSGSTSNASYEEYIIFAGRRVAQSNPYSGSVQYLFADHLGSTRIMTQANGTVCFDSEYYPYGQEMSHTASCGSNYKFTGYERDAETGNDYAFARYYSPRLGRFLSADPLASSADTSDPQTLNRYTYARNNPINFTDPLGLDNCPDSNIYQCTVTATPTPTPPPVDCYLGNDGNYYEQTYQYLTNPGGYTDPPCPYNPSVTDPWLESGGGDTGGGGGGGGGGTGTTASSPQSPGQQTLRSPTCTALQQNAVQLANALDKASTATGWIAFASGVGTVLAGAGEGFTFGGDTPVTITFGSATAFFTTASTITGGGAAYLNSFANGNSITVANFGLSQLANFAAAAGASKIPSVKPWADRIGDLAGQAADLAHKAGEACQ